MIGSFMLSRAPFTSEAKYCKPKLSIEEMIDGEKEKTKRQIPYINGSLAFTHN